MGAGFLKQGFVNVMATRAFRIARHAASTQDWLHFMNVYYTDTAKQQLKELERPFQKRILDKVAVYASLPNPLEFAEPLAGYDMNRFRVGDYRVAFQIDQNIISLADIRQTTNSRQPALRRQ
jgi:mRNA-degrading endonuclease RelE of RelBE toxin-antitoxin system